MARAGKIIIGVFILVVLQVNAFAAGGTVDGATGGSSIDQIIGSACGGSRCIVAGAGR